MSVSTPVRVLKGIKGLLTTARTQVTCSPLARHLSILNPRGTFSLSALQTGAACSPKPVAQHLVLPRPASGCKIPSHLWKAASLLPAPPTPPYSSPRPQSPSGPFPRVSSTNPGRTTPGCTQTLLAGETHAREGWGLGAGGWGLGPGAWGLGLVGGEKEHAPEGLCSLALEPSVPAKGRVVPKTARHCHWRVRGAIAPSRHAGTDTGPREGTYTGSGGGGGGGRSGRATNVHRPSRGGLCPHILSWRPHTNPWPASRPKGSFRALWAAGTSKQAPGQSVAPPVRLETQHLHPPPAATLPRDFVLTTNKGPEDPQSASRSRARPRKRQRHAERDREGGTTRTGKEGSGPKRREPPRSIVGDGAAPREAHPRAPEPGCLLSGHQTESPARAPTAPISGTLTEGEGVRVRPGPLRPQGPHPPQSPHRGPPFPTGYQR